MPQVISSSSVQVARLKKIIEIRYLWMYGAFYKPDFQRSEKHSAEYFKNLVACFC